MATESKLDELQEIFCSGLTHMALLLVLTLATLVSQSSTLAL
jgi:hypothetical protein